MKKYQQKNQKHSSHLWMLGTVLLISTALILGTVLQNIDISHAQENTTNLNVNISGYAPSICDIASSWYDIGGGLVSFGQGGAIPGLVGGSVNIIVNVPVCDLSSYDNDTVNVKGRLYTLNFDDKHIEKAGGTEINLAMFNVSDVETYTLPKEGPVNCSLVAISNYQSWINGKGIWRCQTQIHYLSNPTEAGSSVNESVNFTGKAWDWIIWMNDSVGAPTTDQASRQFEYPNILGLTTDTYINFGITDTKGNETAAQIVNVENKGNQKLDISLQTDSSDDSVAWYCTGGGNPLVSDVHYAINSGDLNYNKMTLLNFSGAPTTETTFDLERGVIRTTASKGFETFRFATTQPIGQGVCTLSTIVLTALKGY